VTGHVRNGSSSHGPLESGKKPRETERIPPDDEADELGLTTLFSAASSIPSRTPRGSVNSSSRNKPSEALSVFA
jgi:hypothetical protein